MSKWDGWMEVPLEVSQVKQIAGRAGRYGMGVEGGVVTTLEPSDLPIIRAAMSTEPEALRYARVGLFRTTITDILGALPHGSTATTVHDALVFGSALPPSMAVVDPERKGRRHDTLHRLLQPGSGVHGARLYVAMSVPLVGRSMQSDHGSGAQQVWKQAAPVDLHEILLDSGLLATLEQVLASKGTKRAPFEPRRDLRSLETLHSVLTIYAWLALRDSTAFYAYDLAVALRKATQEAMDHCLRSFNTRSSIRRPDRTLGFGSRIQRQPFATKVSTYRLHVWSSRTERWPCRNSPEPRHSKSSTSSSTTGGAHYLHT
jgi:ATP-dependent RNA helicase SUPV3L1/SUV3